MDRHFHVSLITTTGDQFMKKFLVSMIAVLSMNAAYAERYEGRHENEREWRHESRHESRHEMRHEMRHERNDAGRWIMPALLGGFIAYELARPHVVYAQPAVIARQDVYRVPAPQPVYREFIEYDPGCNCYMHIQRQIGWQ